MEARGGRHDIKSDLQQAPPQYPTTHASSVFVAARERTAALSLFSPKTATKKNNLQILLPIAGNLVKSKANRGGGMHHTFGACDRCQSSATFSSFLCFSGRFTSSSTHRLDIPPVSMSFPPSLEVAFGEEGGWVRWAHDQSFGRREQVQSPC